MQKEGKISENWYLVLGLEFDPKPVVEEEIIEEKIEEKRKFWARSENDIMHGPEYRKYRQMLPTIRKDMIGEENIRQELIQDAIQRTYGPIDVMLKEIGLAEITEEMVEQIAKKHGSSPQIVKKRAKAAGIRIDQKKAEYQRLYDQYYKEKPENAEKYNAVKMQLEVFGANNLYEFLFPGQTWQKSRKNTSETVLAVAQGKRETEFYKNDSLSGTGSKLCAQCEEIFATPETKKKYDDVLEYNERKAILDHVKELCEITGGVQKASYTDNMAKLSEIISPTEKAEKVLKAFCSIEKLPILYQIAPERNDKKNTKATTNQAQAEEKKQPQEFSAPKEEYETQKEKQEDNEKWKENERWKESEQWKENEKWQENERRKTREVRKTARGFLFVLAAVAIWFFIIRNPERDDTGNSQGNQPAANTQSNSNTQNSSNTPSDTEPGKNGGNGSDTNPSQSGTKGNTTQPTQSANKGSNTSTQSTNKGSNTEPTKSVNKGTNTSSTQSTNKGTNTKPASTAQGSGTQPSSSKAGDDIEAVTECAADFLDSVNVLEDVYEGAYTTSEFSSQLKTMRRQAGKLEDGLLMMEEIDTIYAAIKEYSKDYSYSDMEVNIQNNNTATCSVTISYWNLPHAVLLARMFAAKETEDEEDISDTRWNQIYLANIKKAIEQKEILEEEEVTFYLEYTENRWKINKCDDITKVYNALAGSTLEELDYDWLERYEKGTL